MAPTQSLPEMDLECPNTIGEFLRFNLTEKTNVTIVVPESGLCTLFLETASSKYIPVARSYNGNGWERSGGNFAAKNLLEWRCNQGQCFTVLPDGESYVLEQRPVRQATTTESWARFLESATYGVTPDDLLFLESRSFAGFLRNQVDLKPTSHREFYRRRLGSVLEHHYPEFATRANPCAAHSLWRRKFFTEKDVNKDITVRSVTGGREISVDGEVRSVLQNFRTVDSSGVIQQTILDGNYELCSNNEASRRGWFLIRLSDGRCYRVNPDDTFVEFPPEFTPPNVANAEAGQLDDSSTWESLPVYQRSSPIYRRLTPLGSATCAGNEQDRTKLPDAFRAANATIRSKIPTIFAKAGDAWLLFQPIADVRENSLESPLEDGGLEEFSRGQVDYCANTPRSFQNEEYCMMSKEEACTVTLEDHNFAGVVVCGSPGEVANDPSLSVSWLEPRSIPSRLVEEFGLPRDISLSAELERQREFVWNEIALTSKDQVRQRMAWALFQIFSLPKISINLEKHMTEDFIAYYDIFVRNAFGNYRDILREITYNSLMAESLSYLRSVSLGVQFASSGVLAYPDENFARELMQLFTIGVIELEEDGTPAVGPDGTVRETYTSDDIANFARAWTGFRNQNDRANVDSFDKRRSRIDPMRIVALHRDRFPKANLKGGFIGDGYPLCKDLPERSHLRRDAKYRLLGRIALPELVEDNPEWALLGGTKRLQLNPSSPLHEHLCARSGGETCSYPSVVHLPENLGCVGSIRQRAECDVDIVRVVQVDDVYYEYIPRPCVELTFFDNGQQVRRGVASSVAVCANPELPVASEACCDSSSNAQSVCAYGGERMRFSTAVSRCASVNRTVCDFRRLESSSECPHKGYHWAEGKCEVLVKVNSEGGVAVVHDLPVTTPLLKTDTPSFFDVQWQRLGYPNKGNNCGNGVCTQVENSCICNTRIVEEPVFTSLPNGREEIVEQLSIGYPDPALFDDTWVRQEESGFSFFSPNGGCCDQFTVFEVVDKGETKFFKNTKSQVWVRGSTFHFRNPPSFNSVIPDEVSVLTAQQETEAVLDYFFYHPNTAPFVSHRLIQRFGISNPSPTYVRAVAQAFTKGKVVYDGEEFGTGKYGDLEATVSEILLNREARSEILDSDPSQASLREPILKVISFMRGMKFQSSVPLLNLDLMNQKIGQAPYEQPSVFNFFRPEFSPPGIGAEATLVAPEAEVMSTGRTVGIINGLISLVRDGLVECDNGFGSFGCPDSRTLRLYGTSGELGYQFDSTTTREQNIQEMNILLTAGRLSDEKRNLITQATSVLSVFENAMLTALSYIATTPEFHSTSSTRAALTHTPKAEPSTPPDGRPDGGYRAVIHIGLRGGCDSYNVLAPHTTCDLYPEYKKTRSFLALNETDMLKIDGVTGQTCSAFGIHSGLPILQSLYNQGELMFFANTGVMTQPVTKENYVELTQTTLFAHNLMQDEIDALDPFNTAPGTGTLGRMADVLQSKGYRVGRTSVESSPANLGGRDVSVSPIYTLDETGVDLVDITDPSVLQVIDRLNGGENGESTGVHGEIWSSILSRSVNQTDTLYYILQSSTATQTEFANNEMGQRVRLISQLVQTHQERKVDRDFFFVTMPGYDHHTDVTPLLAENFVELNRALTDLVSELKAQGVWDNVVIVQTSDFGRTLTPNSSDGSDHGWGGNYWIAGGNVQGGQVKGKYPSSFEESAEENIGRGRLIPTTPFDSIFHGVADWTGVETDDEFSWVLPNRNNFENLCLASDLFES